MSGWIALGRVPEGWRGFAVDGGKVSREAQGAGEAAVLEQLGGAGSVLRLGEGSPDHLPAAVVPKAGRAFAGLMQDEPPDVAGGWTRLWLAGYLAPRPDFDGVVVATEGDTRHWLHLSAGEAVSMQGVVTPRLQAALGGAENVDAGAVADTLSRPERLAAHLHAAGVTGRPDRVSGHLLGAELAAARVYWLGRQVVVLGAEGDPVAMALQAQGGPVACVDAGTLIAPGLAAVGEALGLGA